MPRLEIKDEIYKYGCNRICEKRLYKFLIIYGVDSSEVKEENYRGFTKKQLENILEVFNNCHKYKCKSHREEIKYLGEYTGRYRYIPQRWDRFDWKKRVYIHQFDKKENK